MPDETEINSEAVTNTDGSSNTNKKDKRPFIQEFFDMVDAIVIAVVCAVLILTLVVRTGFVDGESMETTMYANDRYILSGLFYTPEQYDIVVFQPESVYNNGDNKLWVKRVIATAGQTVSISDDGKVLVDGKELDESAYLTQLTYERQGANVTFPLEVPEGYVFLMGDNRAYSKDSRIIGCVDIRRILGKVIFRFYSANPANSIGLIS